MREPGDGSPLCRYEPQTERLRPRPRRASCASSTPSAPPARRSRPPGSPARYLEEIGIARPGRAAPARRARRRSSSSAGCGWAAPTSRSTTSASTPRSTSSRPAATSTPARSRSIVPLRGLQMPVARLDLAGASIVRADTVDVPAEARSSDGLGVSPWEPTFLAVVRVAERRPTTTARRPTPGVAAVERLPPAGHDPAPVQGRRRRARPARLDPGRRRPLAPDRDRRRAPRPGGYRLTEDRARRAGRLLARARAPPAPPSPGSPTTGPASRPRSAGR